MAMLCHQVDIQAALSAYTASDCLLAHSRTAEIDQNRRFAKSAVRSSGRNWMLRVQGKR